MKCRLCNSQIEPKDNWWSILAVAALIGWLSFMAGQVWTRHQISPLYEQRIQKDGEIKRELQKGYLPPKKG